MPLPGGLTPVITLWDPIVVFFPFHFCIFFGRGDLKCWKKLGAEFRSLELTKEYSRNVKNLAIIYRLILSISY